MLLSPVNPVDATTKTWRSSPIFQAPIEREKSQAASAVFFVDKRSTFSKLTHLPSVSDKPGWIDDYRGRNWAVPGRQRVVLVRNEHYVGNGSCVAYARFEGFEIGGIARNVPILAKRNGYLTDLTPEIGSIIVTRESSAGTYTGHVTGRITIIEGRWGYISEQNYRRKQITEGWIDLTSPLIVAFIHPKT